MLDQTRVIQATKKPLSLLRNTQTLPMLFTSKTNIKTLSMESKWNTQMKKMFLLNLIQIPHSMEFLDSNRMLTKISFNNYIIIKKSVNKCSPSISLKIKPKELINSKTSLPSEIMKNIYVLKKFGNLMSNKIIKLHNPLPHFLQLKTIKTVLVYGNHKTNIGKLKEQKYIC